MARGTLFLERNSYRQRRLMDAVRVLPFVGLAFWMLPLLWPAAQPGSEETLSMSGALKYLFGVWIGLILAALVLWINTRMRVSETPASDKS